MEKNLQLAAFMLVGVIIGYLLRVFVASFSGNKTIVICQDPNLEREMDRADYWKRGEAAPEWGQD